MPLNKLAFYAILLLSFVVMLLIMHPALFGRP